MRIASLFLMLASVGRAQIDIVAIANVIQSAFNPPPPMYTNIYGNPGTESPTPTICSPVITVPYTAFQQATAIASVPLLTVPDRWSPSTVEVEETAQFILAPPVRTMNFWIEPAPGAGWYYIAPTALGTVPPNNWTASSVSGRPALITSHTLWFTIQIQGVNPGVLKDLTAGSVTIRACGLKLPGAALAPYSPMPQFTYTAQAKTCTSTYSPYPFPVGGSPWITSCL